MVDGFFISGTDTNVGKTIVSAILVEKFSGIYWKPIQCGVNKFGEKDSDIIMKLCNKKEIIEEFFFLKNPLSPNIASKKDGIKIDLSAFKSFFKKKIFRTVIIEGAGGLNVPINDNQLIVDLAKMLGFPIILVCRTKVGTINHTLSSIETIKKKKIKLLGLIFVGKSQPETIETIKKFGKSIYGKEIKVLSQIPILKKINKATINRLTDNILI